MVTIRKGLSVFETFISKTKGKYCFGDEVTMADVFLIPQLYNAERFKMDIATEFPCIAEVKANLDLIPEFEKAHANSQSDAVL